MFATKLEQAIAMVRDALQLGLSASWFAGDEVYSGRRHRRSYRELGRCYAVAVKTDHVITCGFGKRWEARHAINKVRPEQWQRMRMRTGTAPRAPASTTGPGPSSLPSLSLRPWQRQALPPRSQVSRSCRCPAPNSYASCGTSFCPNSPATRLTNGGGGPGADATRPFSCRLRVDADRSRQPEGGARPPTQGSFCPTHPPCGAFHPQSPGAPAVGFAERVGRPAAAAPPPSPPAGSAPLRPRRSAEGAALFPTVPCPRRRSTRPAAASARPGTGNGCARARLDAGEIEDIDHRDPRTRVHLPAASYPTPSRTAGALPGRPHLPLADT